ncbi:hypothetical protein IPH25_00465 [bacterium]|nr:MAG: hypothetical protein IPG37_02580 [bacterium]QQR61907.1 MAG: hypothetical protein IPH25_00465 [bacterium]QQR62506.1 MAG: hypothetical protein IPH67_03735 [bacterium]
MVWPVESEPFNIGAGDQKEKLLTVRYMQGELEKKRHPFYHQFNTADKMDFATTHLTSYCALEGILEMYQDQIYKFLSY